jgi:Alkaline phosphatase PhoX
MRRQSVRRKTVVGIGLGVLTVGTAVAVATTAFAVAGSTQGDSSSQDPYLVRALPGITTTSLLTAGDAVNGYRMTGIPDGLGAFDNGDGTFTVVMNHEIASGGAVRAHGANGAFVSKWIIDKDSLEVLSGEDLIKRIYTWSGSAWTAIPAGSSTLSLSRLCSADLPAVGAFYDAASGLGTQERIFMNGEESGAEGRGIATVVTGPDAGSAYHIPWLGRFSWENSVAKPDAGEATVVVGLDDSGNGQVYVYVGNKKATGNDVEKAGLTGGTLYGLKIDGVASENDATALPGGHARFTLVPVGDASTLTGAALETASRSAGISGLNRPEDGSWDPSDAHNFYFNTTAAFNGISRIWKLHFDDPANVLAGGDATIEVASPAFDPAKSNADQAGPRMLDNMTVNDRGQVISLEDVGGNAYIGGVYQYDPSTGAVARIAQFDPALFTPGAKDFITQDEEASGVIPATFLGEGMYLIDAQVHLANPDPVLVEGGQLLLLHIPPGRPV